MYKEYSMYKEWNSICIRNSKFQLFFFFFFYGHLLGCDALGFLPQDNFLLRVFSPKMGSNTSRGRKKLFREWLVGQARHRLVPWFEKDLGFVISRH